MYPKSSSSDQNNGCCWGLCSCEHALNQNHQNAQIPSLQRVQNDGAIQAEAREISYFSSTPFWSKHGGYLSEGVRNETLDQQNKKLSNPPPLLFVHGSFHAAWRWAEHWLPFFSQNGFDSYAISLLGQVHFFI